MSHQYYNCWFRLDTHDSYLIWFTDEEGGVITDANGKVPCFLKTEDLFCYASSLNLPIVAVEPLLPDLDFVASWLKTKDEMADCKKLLNAWNLFEDVSHSVGGNFDIDRKLTVNIYEKLFWGNNIPVVTSVGEKYEPKWSKRELKITREVLANGLSIFREKIIFV